MRRALVVGCAENVWKDVERAEGLCSYDSFYLVKLAGVHWRRQEPFVWVTLHPEFMAKYKQERAELGLHSNYEVVGPLASEVGRHSHEPVDRRVTYRWPGMNSSGSSGLFAVKLALDDGHDRVVLAGIPMETKDGHFTRKKPWVQRDSFIPGWEKALGHYRDKTRSVSGGWTEKLLGAPTPKWLGLISTEAAGATPALISARG